MKYYISICFNINNNYYYNDNNCYDNDYDDNENRMSAISITTNDTVESSQSISNSIFKFFIDRRSIISIDTKSIKDSIGNSNTNWHSDRTLIYTYYSCLYDHNSLSLLSLILIIIFIPIIISLPNLIIPLGTIYDTNNSSSIINSCSTSIASGIAIYLKCGYRIQLTC